jgi:hypothetical protein
MYDGGAVLTVQPTILKPRLGPIRTLNSGAADTV